MLTIAARPWISTNPEGVFFSGLPSKSPCLITGKDLTRAFHLIEPFWKLCVDLLIHSTTESVFIYFWVTTFDHKLSDWTILHLVLAARAMGFFWIFFSPHPPNNSGIARESHLNQGITKLSFWPPQINLKHNFLILFGVPFGIQAIENQ